MRPSWLIVLNARLYLVCTITLLILLLELLDLNPHKIVGFTSAYTNCEFGWNGLMEFRRGLTEMYLKYLTTMFYCNQLLVLGISKSTVTKQHRIRKDMKSGQLNIATFKLQHEVWVKCSVVYKLSFKFSLVAQYMWVIF